MNVFPLFRNALRRGVGGSMLEVPVVQLIKTNCHSEAELKRPMPNEDVHGEAEESAPATAILRP